MASESLLPRGWVPGCGSDLIGVRGLGPASAFSTLNVEAFVVNVDPLEPVAANLRRGTARWLEPLLNDFKDYVSGLEYSTEGKTHLVSATDSFCDLRLLLAPPSRSGERSVRVVRVSLAHVADPILLVLAPTGPHAEVARASLLAVRVEQCRGVRLEVDLEPGEVRRRGGEGAVERIGRFERVSDFGEVWDRDLGARRSRRACRRRGSCLEKGPMIEQSRQL